MKRFLFWLITLSIVAGTSAAAYSFRSAKRNGNNLFRMASMHRADIIRVVNSSGTVKPVRSVEIGSFVSGPVLKVYVDFNSKVTKGQLLAQIDPRLYVAALARETATLAHSKADLSRVETLLAQSQRLEKRGLLLEPQHAISETDLEQFTTDRKAYEAQVLLAQAIISQSKASLATAQANMEFTEIKSPVDGIVTDRKVDPGQTVAASFQTPTMFVIAPDLDQKVYVYASVDEADIGMIRDAQTNEQPVTFTVDAYPNDTFTGKIAQVRLNPTTVQNVVTYTVIVESPNPACKLLPGMTANLAFQIEKRTQVLVVPNTALRFRPKVNQVRIADRAILTGETADTQDAQSDSAADASEAADGAVAAAQAARRRHVWVCDGDLLTAVPVTVGVSNKNASEIVAGEIHEGQEVVVGIKSTATK